VCPLFRLGVGLFFRLPESRARRALTSSGTETPSPVFHPAQRHMPRAAQMLLGFGVHDGIAAGEGFLGAVDNSNPIDLLAAGRL
jgi:hypothetical protein